MANLAGLDDAELLARHARLAEKRRRIDAALAASSAEIDRRSARELGYDGLAQRLGSRTPELLVEQLTGVSRREATSLVRVGALLDTDSPLAAPVSQGALSIEAADVIDSTLGQVASAASPAAIAQATERLASEAPTMSLTRLAQRAREVRDELDAEGVAHHEHELRDRRYLRLVPQSDGAVRLTGLLDPESAALVTSVFDAVTAPRRPSFSSTPAPRDDRTRDQRMADTLVDIVRLSTHAEPGTLYGDRRPAVRVLVAERDLARGVGSAHLEGSNASVSIATAARHACDAGIQPIAVGESLRLGRSQRLFTARQRIALAARDGGCRFPGCDRPPSWCEAHHIVPWSSGGRTDLDDGILLCRHHHLLIHNNGWRITRVGAQFTLHPPASVGQPIDMPSRSAVWREVMRAG
jgi:hypothetical protein